MSVAYDKKTPGVYIQELDAFPPSVVGVQTAVPAFIGYTETAVQNGKQAFFKPVKIRSMADYEQSFGKKFQPLYDIKVIPPTDPDYDFTFDAVNYRIAQTHDSKFYLYHSLKLFYDNGGGDAYIVSVGDYTDGGTSPDGVTITYALLKQGLDVIADQVGPTMLVIPDATLLPADKDPITGSTLPKSADFKKLVQDMISQCNKQQDRVAILDVYGTEHIKSNETKTTLEADLDAIITEFRKDVGDDHLNYAMGYFPWVNSTVVSGTDIDYNFFNLADDFTLFQTILDAQAAALYTGTALAKVQEYINNTNPHPATPPPTPIDVKKNNQNLVNALPILSQMEGIIAQKMNVLPPSGGMAGVFTRVDNDRGVWNAPANVDMKSVDSPTLKLNDDEQGDLNLPLDGKAVNVIRDFVGRGPVVWGARTLDGNSNDWRYIQVRRTLIYIEQSLQTALNQFVFAANDGNTWVTVVSMASNFLQSLWSQGGLMGATANEAYTVQCGLGSTMTSMDILQGYMIVQVTLQMVHPAEFIILTFKQKMGAAS
jgi:phage tail sheath protein FI